MDFLLLALSLSLPLGAVYGYRRVHAEAVRWGLEQHAGDRRREAYRDAGRGDRFTRRRVPTLVSLAAMIAGAGLYGLSAMAVLGVFYVLAVLVTPNHAPLPIVLGLFAGLTLTPLGMAYALYRYLAALVLVQENVPANVDGAVAVVALLLTPSVLALAAITNQPGWLLLGVPVLGAILVFAGAAQTARNTALSEAERLAHERAHLHG